jgi:hypothetical protein
MTIDWLITQFDLSVEHWSELAGYLASFLVFLTFCMKTIVPLRLLAIASNVVFIVYAVATGLMPVLVLHAALLPMNILRTVQQIRLLQRVRSASLGDARVEALVPFMTVKTYPEDTVIFSKDELAQKIYFLQKGQIFIPEIEKFLEAGTLFGEMGIFTPGRTRTASAISSEECEIYEIGEKDIMQLCIQDPAFGLFLTKLIVGRMQENLSTPENDKDSANVSV